MKISTAIMLSVVLPSSAFAVSENKQQDLKRHVSKVAQNIAAAHGVHIALHASHQAGHVIAAQIALWNGCKTNKPNYSFEFNPVSYGLYATSTVPKFESGGVNAMVTAAGPLLGIIAAVCALKAWHYYYDPQQEKSLKQCILESFKIDNIDNSSLPAIPTLALTHLALNSGILLPINHKVFEGHEIAKDLGWI